MVAGDPARLRQLVMILVDNAIRHSPTGGEVRVAVRADPATARRSTSRTRAAGIRPEDLPHVFERFWRASGAPSGGTGLGPGDRGVDRRPPRRPDRASRTGRGRAAPGSGSSCRRSPARRSPPDGPAPAGSSMRQSVSDGSHAGPLESGRRRHAVDPEPAQEMPVTAPRPAAATTRCRAGHARRRWLLIVVVVVASRRSLAGGGWASRTCSCVRAAPAAVGLSTRRSPTSPTAPPHRSARRERRPRRPDRAPATAPAGTAGGGLDGTWTVDPSVGSFSDFSGSFVGYRVEEELANVGAATAVGRTPGRDREPDASTARRSPRPSSRADLTTLQSDDDRATASSSARPSRPTRSRRRRSR